MSESLEWLRWLRPQLLLALLPLALALVWRRRTKAVAATVGADAASGQSPWTGVIDPALLPHLLTPPRAPAEAATPSRRFPVCEAGAWPALLALLIVALAGPQVPRPGGVPEAPPWRPDASRVLLVDLPPEFDALPESTRVNARANLRRFVRALPAGETALVAVAGAAWLVVPPTEDVAALDAFIDELSAAAVPVPGYRPQLGLALAQATLAATGSRQQTIFWLRATTEPLPAAVAAGQGGARPVFLQVADDGEAWLAAARAARVPPGWVVSALNLPQSPADRWIDLGPLLILLVLPLTAWFLVRPVPTLWGILLLAGALFTPCEVVQAEPAAPAFAEGQAHYRAGRFADAAAAFSRLPPADARAHYNRGNALARAGRLPAALAAYDESLRLRPGDADTLFNRQLVARLLPPPPPPPSPRSPPPQAPPAARQSAEAERAAAQWLRRPPGDVDGLLRSKLALEEARRRSGGAP